MPGARAPEGSRPNLWVLLAAAAWLGGVEPGGLALAGEQDQTVTTDHPGAAAAAAVLGVDDLVSFWDFQQPTGEPRKARGRHQGALVDGDTDSPVTRAEGGLFGPWSGHFRQGQWLRLPREQLGALDIHGPDAEVTVVTWLRREAPSYWQAIAGVWDETHRKRQYMLFLNARTRTDHHTMEREPCQNLVHGHISSVGGPTPGRDFCVTYASGDTAVGFDRWQMLALTYDGREIRVYLDGQLDAHQRFNPFPYDEGIFDGGDDGAEFTVGANHVAGTENNNRFGGWIAGVAVWDRCLTADEMAALAAATLPPEDEAAEAAEPWPSESQDGEPDPPAAAN